VSHFQLTEQNAATDDDNDDDDDDAQICKARPK